MLAFSSFRSQRQRLSVLEIYIFWKGSSNIYKYMKLNVPWNYLGKSRFWNVDIYKRWIFSKEMAVKQEGNLWQLRFYLWGRAAAVRLSHRRLRWQAVDRARWCTWAEWRTGGALRAFEQQLRWARARRARASLEERLSAQSASLHTSALITHHNHTTLESPQLRDYELVIWEC